VISISEVWSTRRERPCYLLNHRSRISRQLEQWLTKISAAIERQAASGQAPPRAEFADYVRELQRIALGQDPTGSARDRLAALKELLKLGAAGTTSYLEAPSSTELARRWQAVHEAKRKRELEKQERWLGLGE
jgi:hypothetical protein